jgi:uncharacterized repeat protein (TIGR03809 family)
MTHRTDVARGHEIVARWCNLAEQRLEHLIEMFDSGRWRRYHSEAAFLENITEARAAVDIWRQLLVREASLDNSPIDLSWLGRGRSKLPRHDLSPVPAREPRPDAAVALVQSTITAMTAAIETAAEVMDESPAASEPAPLKIPVLPVLDLNAIQARYPLLRNTL